MGGVSLSGHVKIDDGSKLEITSVDKIAPLTIESVDSVAPLAVHLKEVNLIDPLNIDSLHISEVKNIDPIEISRFNVTNLPMVNVSLQKIPEVDINLKTLPPVSVGLSQDLCIPSDYTLRARVLGFELMRLHLNGKTSVIPKERARREQIRSDNRSYPVTPAAGNPAIPTHCEHTTKTCCPPLYPQHMAAPAYYPPPGALQSGQRHESVGSVAADSMSPYSMSPGQGAVASVQGAMSGGLSFGMPLSAFQLPGQADTETLSEHRVMTGD